MKFILTGHKGLIGSFLLKRLMERGDTPLLLIDKREGKDILDIGSNQLIEKADIFIHLASFCKINKTIEDPELAFQNNVMGTFKVLEFCRKNKISKIVFTSSSRVLSKEKNPYTASKFYGEELIKSYSECYGLKYVIIRPSTVYGPFNDKTRRLMDVFIINALKGEELKIFGDNDKTLDFTFIDDFLDGFLIAMNQNNDNFNISFGEEVNISRVADIIISLTGKGTKSFCPAEKAQPQKVKVDISKIKKLGYSPKIKIEEGIKKTFDWYKENFKEIENRNDF